MIREKNKIRKKYIIYNNPRDELEFLLIKKRCEIHAKFCYNNYIQKLESSIKSNPKFFWSHIKNKRDNKDSYPSTLSYGSTCSSDGNRICELFASFFSSVYCTDKPSQNSIESRTLCHKLNSDSLTILAFEKEEVLKKLRSLDVTKGAGPDGIPPYFIRKCAHSLASPLAEIYNTSLISGTFPDLWKAARVVPVHKSGDKTQVTNYRPISILSTVAKVFEALLCPYVQHYFDKYLMEMQHGFVKSRGTTTNLTSFIEMLSRSIDNNKQTDAIYTDFRKAFDTVSHSILISKLSAYGVSGPLLRWFKSYLTNRSFAVVVKGFKSNDLNIASGVPQGSHLGPILFNIFLNDISNCFLNSTPYIFADDIKFSREINSYEDVSLLQDDLNRVLEWCKTNHIYLNSAKCSHIKFTRKHNPIQSSYAIEHYTLTEVEEQRDLGIVIDSKLSFTSHIDSVVKRSSQLLGFITRNTRSFKDSRTKILLYYALVRSILEYCSVVWRPHFSTHLLRIERVQKRFLWHLSYSANIAHRLGSYEERLDYFQILSLSNRGKMLDISFLHKILHGSIDSAELVGLLNFRIPTKYPRKQILPFVPPLRKTVLGANSPMSRITKLANDLPNNIDIFADSLSVIKNKMKILYT